MQITDAHLHFFDLSHHRDWYPQLPDFARAVQTPELAEDCAVDDHRRMAGDHHEIARMVHVSATTTSRAYLQETRWVSEIADAQDLDLRIIGSVDPSLDSAELVADLQDQASSPRFVGVRVLEGLEPDSGATDTILGWLAERGLVFDLVCQPPAMSGWLRALERHPGLTVVLEHTGWPSGTDDQARDLWRTALRDYATNTDGACKLSGLGMVTMDVGADALLPWLGEAAEILGWQRTAFGSNLPIELMGGSPATMFATLDRLLESAAPEDRTSFWSGTADRVYWGTGSASA